MADKVQKNKKTNPIIIAWLSRYSKTMEDDDMGRWARVAYAGNFNSGMPFYRGQVCQWEIAWVKKLIDPTTKKFMNKFVVHPQYPYNNGSYVFDTLEEAQLEVERTFRFFIKMVLKSDKQPKVSLKIGK